MFFAEQNALLCYPGHVHETRVLSDGQSRGMHPPSSPVGEGGDDKPAVVPEVLVAVQLHGVDHLARDRPGLARVSRLSARLPVVPQLRQPVELSNVRNLRGDSAGLGGWASASVGAD